MSDIGIGRWRITIGFLQGIIAWLLLRLVPPALHRYQPDSHDSALYWVEQHPRVFAALALLTAFVPVIAIVEVGRMRRKSLATYVALAATIIAALAAYDLWRDPIASFGATSLERLWPSFRVSFCTAFGLFIINQLLEHRERGHSLFSHYVDHFEDSWMRGFQLGVSLVFSLLVWGILELGAALFDLIHVGWFRTMIGHNWFRCPALAMAFAAAIHITDVRPSLLRGMRNVGLTLLSWLLPLVVTLCVGFLIALMFVGLKPLWATRHAASIFLWACAITLILLNAAYKDGYPTSLPSAVIRWAGRVSGPTMLLLAVIATYAIALRVQEYGWTPERVLSAAVALMALVYGSGYAYATFDRAGWLHPMQNVNVFASLVIVAILALLLTPVADPARLSVNSQLARLAAGKVAPSRFDYQFFRFNSGVFGTRALGLLESNASAEVRSRAAQMQANKAPNFFANGEPDPALTERAFTHAVVYPKGSELPRGLENTESPLADYGFDCLRNGAPCEIYLVPYGDNRDTVVIVRPMSPGNRQPPAPVYALPARLFQRDASGKWVNTGTFDRINCPGVVDGLRAGQLSWARPEHDDLLVNGVRLEFSKLTHGADQCPPAFGR
jgi:Domain of unknown function (DUF4153)